MPTREVCSENEVFPDKHGLIASVAYALWQERRRRNAPDDPEADWLHAEELIEDLENLQRLVTH